MVVLVLLVLLVLLVVLVVLVVVEVPVVVVHKGSLRCPPELRHLMQLQRGEW